MALRQTISSFDLGMNCPFCIGASTYLNHNHWFSFAVCGYRPGLWSACGPAPGVSLWRPILQSKSSSVSWKSWQASSHWFLPMLKLQVPGKPKIWSMGQTEEKNEMSKLTRCFFWILASIRGKLVPIFTHHSPSHPIHQHSRPCCHTPGGTQRSGHWHTWNQWLQDSWQDPRHLKHTKTADRWKQIRFLILLKSNRLSRKSPFFQLQKI